MLIGYVFITCRSHREDIITHFFIPNKTDPRNAARSCPACRNVFHNPSDAITHAQKCLDLIKDQENWIEGRRNEDAVATPSSNGSVSRQISAESSNDGVESRPSCHECGKFFKVKLILFVLQTDPCLELDFAII